MKKTAIVVDDEPDIVDIFSDLLREREIDVIAKGYSGKEAIDLWTSNKPDILFIDIMMPDGTGIYTIKKIRQKNKNAFIIAVTADDSIVTEAKLKDLNVNGIAYKPVDMDKIMEIINAK
jgi:two-component system, chemotaxis family, chemotaxis protein CheY